MSAYKGVLAGVEVTIDVTKLSSDRSPASEKMTMGRKESTRRADRLKENATRIKEDIRTRPGHNSKEMQSKAVLGE